MFIRFDVIHERDGDGQTLHDSKDHGYASHRAVIKIYLGHIYG